MRWSWNHATDKCGGTLDPVLWELTQNPGLFADGLAGPARARAAADPAFRKNIDDLLQAKRVRRRRNAAWFQQHHPQAP
jgi:starch phosphorylase